MRCTSARLAWRASPFDIADPPTCLVYLVRAYPSVLHVRIRAAANPASAAARPPRSGRSPAFRFPATGPFPMSGTHRSRSTGCAARAGVQRRACQLTTTLTARRAPSDRGLDHGSSVCTSSKNRLITPGWPPPPAYQSPNSWRLRKRRFRHDELQPLIEDQRRDLGGRDVLVELAVPIGGERLDLRRASAAPPLLPLA